MSTPTCYPIGHPQREREQREAESRFESALNLIWRKPDELSAALYEAGDGNDRLAEIAKLSLSDEAEAGRQLREFAKAAANNFARLIADCEEEVPKVDVSGAANELAEELFLPALRAKGL